MSKQYKTKFGRVLAVFLIIGGLAGIALGVLSLNQYENINYITTLSLAVFIPLFIWSGITGLWLWRGEPRGWKWATILFFLQIPVFTGNSFIYEYFTGLAFRLTGGWGHDIMFHLGMGAGAKFFINTGVADFAFGVNFLAIVAVYYLIDSQAKRGTRTLSQKIEEDA